MVRMSDLVRGIVREERAVPPTPAPPEPPRPAPPRERPEVTTVPRTSLAPPPPSREVAPPPEPVSKAPPEPIEVEPPAENADVIFGELQKFLGLAHQAVRTGGTIPWAILEGVVDRAIASLRYSSDLFWIANKIGRAHV